MADPEVVEAMLSVLLDGPRVVSLDVLRRTTAAEVEAFESLMQSELEMLQDELKRTRAARVQSVRECADAAQAFLDSHPEWGT